MRLRLTFAEQNFTATLEDNASAHDLMSLLPLDLTISDYSSNEKIAHLPRKLAGDGSLATHLNVLIDQIVVADPPTDYLFDPKF